MTDTIDLQVLLNTVNITDKVDLGKFPVTKLSAINEELDTLNLTIQNGDALGIKGWQEIVVKDGAEVIFGGYVLTPSRAAGANLAANSYAIGASDYGAYLEKVFIQALFIDKTDAEILAAIFSGTVELSGFDGATHVVAVRTIPRVLFNRKSVREILNWLCEQSGGHWYVDENKALHYWGEVEYLAPFDITHDPEDATKETVENVKVNVDAAGVVNVIEVVGGMALGGDETFKYTQPVRSGTLYLNKRFSPWDGESKIVVRRNEGGATTNLLVNPSFETNITDGWTQYQAGAGAVWAQDDTKYHQGVKSLKITAGNLLSMVRGANITLNPGEPLTGQAMSWCDTAAMASVAIYDVSGSVVLAETTNRKTSAWERLTVLYTNTSGAAMTVRVELRNNGTDSAKIVYFDAVQAEKLAYPSAYCDGTLGTGYSWSGTAHNSTSARVDMPVWVTLTVKIGNSSELAGRDEVLYFDSDGRLEQETYWPTLLNAIEIDGQEEKLVRAIVRNYASYAFYGKWLKGVIEDRSIVDSKVARMRGATELAKNAFESEAITYFVRKTGLKAGQTQNIHLPHRGLDGNFMIQRVTTTISAGGFVMNQVELGAADQSLVGLLLQMKRASGETFDYSEDEILDNILDFTDTVTVTESGATVTGDDGPYQYDVDKWDYSKYGAE